MQLQTYDLTNGGQGSHKFALQPAMQLEPDIEEETKIRDLERKIGDARRQNQPVGSLMEERQRTYESWITRLTTELDNAKDKTVREELEQQLERARRDYGP
jgi:hypothetical protein